MDQSSSNDGKNDDKSLIRICGIIGVLCSACNLFGDLYYMDYSTAHCTDDSFFMIKEEMRSGYLFSFDQPNQSLVFLAQAGGWVYPIWAMATAIPLYIGFQEREEIGAMFTCGGLSWRKCRATVPLIILVYGLCIVGGAFHSAFAFLTVLPNAAHYPSYEYNDNKDDDGWSNLIGTEQFTQFLDTAQTGLIERIFIGGLPGLLSYYIASIWIACLVHSRSNYHHFNKWFNLFNPMVTSLWVQIVAAILPDPLGKYIAGCIGTWGLLFLNLGSTYYLWDINDAKRETKTPSSALLKQYTDDGSIREYNTVS